VLLQPKGAASLLLSPEPGSEVHKTKPGSGQRVVELTDVFQDVFQTHREDLHGEEFQQEKESCEHPKIQDWAEHATCASPAKAERSEIVQTATARVTDRHPVINTAWCPPARCSDGSCTTV